ncbi:hypothetical protein EAH87_00455 [Sphingomonas koreensis]|nr:hypothetical protein EAH87_00455 [Sphingomonas koreensis]
MTLRSIGAALILSLLSPGVAQAQLSRFHPEAQRAPHPPAGPIGAGESPPQWQQADQRDAWYRSMMWCRSHADQASAHRKACRSDAKH